MKPSIIIGLFTFCLLANMAGATEIGPGPVSGDWYESENPYNINGEIFLPAGETLNIHEGVQVVFQGHYKLIVNGHLEAVGTQASPILFTAVNTLEGWHGIRIIDAMDTSHLTWCIIEYGRAVGVDIEDPDGRGGGVFCENSSLATSQCIFRENSATGIGGGIFLIYSNSEISECTFTDNISDDTCGAIATFLGSLTIENCTVTRNYAGRWGGGIGDGYGDLTVCNCTITDNTSEYWAGGIGGDTTTMNIADNVISGNSALEQRGGGVYTFSNCTGTITNNIIRENYAGGNGGGIYLQSTSFTVSGNTIMDNTAYFQGGGIEVIQSSSVTISNNVIAGNDGGNRGGGIDVVNGSDPLIFNNLIYGNEAPNVGGGGVCCSTNSSPLLINNTIAENSAPSGGGVFCLVNSSPTFINTILWGNVATNGKEMWVGTASSPSALTISYSDVDGGMDSVYVVEGSTLDWGLGMIAENPLFCTGMGGNDWDCYYLSQDPCQPGVVNPCVDTGHPFSTLIEGTTRTDCIPDDRIVDMGYHYPLLGTVTADLLCTPESGVLPLSVQFNVMMGNTTDVSRSIAGRIDVTIASGVSYQNWRSGYTNVEPGETYAISWSKTVPALKGLIGPNVFGLHVEDVTAPPWNQPPYPPSGDTATAGCTVTGIAP